MATDPPSSMGRIASNVSPLTANEVQDFKTQKMKSCTMSFPVYPCITNDR